jgi:AraC-like DNA-binding protein
LEFADYATGLPMLVKHEISLRNIQSVMAQAAKGQGERLRSIENDRWLTQLGSNSYSVAYDPYYGRLSTIWHVSPDLILLAGRASLQESLEFPIWLDSGQIAVLIGTRFSCRIGENIICRPNQENASCNISVINSTTELDIKIELLPGETSIIFAAIGIQGDVYPHFPSLGSIIDRIDRSEIANNSGFISNFEGTHDFNEGIVSLLNSSSFGKFGDYYFIAKSSELLINLNKIILNKLDVSDTKTIVSIIIDSINKDPARQISLSEFSRHFMISERSLQRIFKAEAGVPFGVYQRKRRMKRAAELLLYGNQDIERISIACGYYSITAFYRAFKREFGVQPRRFSIDVNFALN